MNRLDLVARKVLGVEGQNAADTIHIHRRHQFRVVDLNSNNLVPDHEAFPLPIGRRRVRQDRQESLDFLRLNQSERNGESEAIVRRGPRWHIPELGHILECEIHRIPAASSLATLSTANGWLRWSGCG